MSKIICKDYQGNSKEVEVSELRFRPSIYGVLIEDGKILLCPSWDGYDFPGGAVELGETLNEALEREFWEETGLKIKMGAIIACESSFFTMPFDGGSVQSVLMYYLCTKVGGELTIANFVEEESGFMKLAQWIDLKDIGALKFSNSVDSVKIIQEAVKKIS